MFWLVAIFSRWSVGAMIAGRGAGGIVQCSRNRPPSKESRIEEGHLTPGHVQMMIATPPNIHCIGAIKGDAPKGEEMEIQSRVGGQSDREAAPAS